MATLATKVNLPAMTVHHTLTGNREPGIRNAHIIATGLNMDIQTFIEEWLEFHGQVDCQSDNQKGILSVANEGSLPTSSLETSNIAEFVTKSTKLRHPGILQVSGGIAV